MARLCDHWLFLVLTFGITRLTTLTRSNIWLKTIGSHNKMKIAGGGFYIIVMSWIELRLSLWCRSLICLDCCAIITWLALLEIQLCVWNLIDQCVNSTNCQLFNFSSEVDFTWDAAINFFRDVKNIEIQDNYDRPRRGPHLAVLELATRMRNRQEGEG